MAILLIIACIAAERFLLEYQHHRDASWVGTYVHRVDKILLPSWSKTGVVWFLLVLSPPLLAVALIQEMLDGLWGGIPELLFSGLILLYCLGPRDLDSDVAEYIEARDGDDTDKTVEAARDLIGDEPPVSEPAMSVTVVETVLIQANARWYAVLFWFTVLGPLGAALYRLANLLQSESVNAEAGGMEDQGRRLSAILDWIPVRVTAFAYALAGNFEDALHRWRNCSVDEPAAFEDSAAQILVCAGGGAIGLDRSSVEDASAQDLLYQAAAAMGLAWRALLIWIALIGVIALTGWV